LYNGFGLIHDGREEREDNDHPLRTFLKTFFPGIGDDDQLSAEMIAFVEAFPTNAAPVVGWQVRVAPPVDAQTLSDIDLMVAQHALNPSRCDVVVKGMIENEPRGFVLIQTAPSVVFQSDADALLPLADVLDLADDSSGLTFTAVPPGSGPRIGINQDLDCLSDGVDAQPQLKNVGDFDADGDVDFGDFGALQLCFGAAGNAVAEPCRCAFDADDDGDVDARDVVEYLGAVTGPS
jgi:hypothetical protein